MHLAVYSYNYAPEPTGIAVYNTALCRWLARRGWQVSMHTGVPWYPHWKVMAGYEAAVDELIDGVEVQRVRHYVPQPPTAKGRILLDATWLLATAWRSLFQRRRPQALLVIAPPFLSGVLGWWLAWRWRVPFLYHIQDLQVDAALDLGLLPRSLAGILLGLERRILTRAALVSTISPAMRRRVVAKLAGAKLAGSRQVHLLPNWVDCSTMRWPRLDNAYRNEWHIPPDGVVIAYSGSIGAKQGLDTLVRAFARLASDERLHLVIAGAGSGLTALHEVARQLGLPRVRFLDLQPVERLPEFLAAADVHAVVQRREAADLVLPSKLLNVLAVGRAMVVTADRSADLARLVRVAGAGVVVEPDDEAALAEGLRHLIADSAARARCGEAGQRFAARCLGEDAVLGQFSRRVQRLVSRRRAEAA